MMTGRTPKGTQHQPTRRRTLSGKYIDNDIERPAFVGKVEKTAQIPAPRTGSYYQRMKDVPTLTPRPLAEVEVEEATARWEHVMSTGEDIDS